MGIICTKNFSSEEVSAVHGSIEPSSVCSNTQTELSIQSVAESLGKSQESISNRVSSRKGGSLEDFYDGIPLVPTTLSRKSRSGSSTQTAASKVSDVSVRLSRAGTIGLEKAVEVLDVLGSSMTDLNSRSGFAFGVVSKGTKISILAFEVANTIMKGSRLMHSLSESQICHLKKEVLPLEAVQKLVSNNEDELLAIVASDRREELALFSGEVIRFGNRCKDPQWHNLDRYFLKQRRDVSPQKQLKEDTESLIQQMMILVQYTAELYHELHALHRFEQDDHKTETGSHGISREELKRQKKVVRKLKKRSLWGRSLDEIMEKLVDVVLFLHLEIRERFHGGERFEDRSEAVEVPANDQRLGPAGLALHYANIILQIDGLVARSCSMPWNARESLYQSLPPCIKSSLRSKLQSFHVKEELTIAQIKTEMEKTLQWLVPIASNTVKSHHGFGWVGEWANSGFEATQEKTDLVRIETLYHADKTKTEVYITEQLVWLHYLVSKSQVTVSFGVKSTIKAPLAKSTSQKSQNATPNVSIVPPDNSPALEHRYSLSHVSDEKQGGPQISNTEVSDSER